MEAVGLKNRSAWLRVGVAVFIGVALVAVALILIGGVGDLGTLRAQVEEFPWRISPGWLLLALGLATLNLFLMGLIWVRLFRAGGGEVGAWSGCRVWLFTNMGRYIPGKVWQLVGLAVYMRERGGFGGQALGASLVFQVLALVTGIGAAAAALGPGTPGLPGGSAARLVVVGLLLLAILHPRLIGVLVRAASRALGEEARVERLSLADYLSAGIGLVGAWAIYGVGFWCLARGLVEAAVPGPVVLTGISAAGYVAGYVALVAPGGIVVREGAIAGLLTAVTPYGLAVSAAIAVAARVWVTLSELLAVAIVVLPVGDRTAPAATTARPNGAGD